MEIGISPFSEVFEGLRDLGMVEGDIESFGCEVLDIGVAAAVEGDGFACYGGVVVF